MSDPRFVLSKGALFGALALAVAAAACSGGGSPAPAPTATPTGPIVLTPTSSPGSGGSPRTVNTPIPTATPTAAASGAPASTPTSASTPAPAASTVAAACGATTSFASDASGGQLATAATANCQTAVTIDYPSFTLNPSTKTNPYVFRLDYDTTLDAAMASTYGATELCKTPPGVLYATFEFDGGTGGPSITFGSNGPDGVGGSVVSSALIPGHTYTAYAAVSKPYAYALGSGTFTPTAASNGQGQYSGSDLDFTPSNYAIPSQLVAEVEVCATN